MKKTTLLLAGLAAALTFGTAACGGDEGRPTKAELLDVVTNQDELDPDAGQCIADGLLASDLTDAELRAVTEDDDSGLSEAQVSSITDTLGQVVVDCDGLA